MKNEPTLKNRYTGDALKTGIAMLHCKKEIYLADGDLAKAEEALRSGVWARGKLFG